MKHYQRKKQISTNILMKCLSLHFVVSIFYMWEILFLEFFFQSLDFKMAPSIPERLEFDRFMLCSWSLPHKDRFMMLLHVNHQGWGKELHLHSHPPTHINGVLNPIFSELPNDMHLDRYWLPGPENICNNINRNIHNRLFSSWRNRGWKKS